MTEPKSQRVGGVLANVSWTTLEQITRMAVSFLVTIQVVNYLGPERFGLYSYVVSVVGILMPLTAFGLEQVVMRRLVEDPGARDRVLGTTFALRNVSGVLAFAAALLFVLTVDHGDPQRLRLTAVAGVMLLFQAFDTVSFYFKSIMGAKYVAFTKLAGQAVFAGTSMALLLTGGQIEGFLWARAAEAATVGAALMAVYRLAGASFSWSFDRAELKSLLRAGFPLFIASLAVMVYMRIDQLMLGQLSSEAELGYYGVAVRLAEIANFVPVALMTALYPGLVEARGRSPVAYRARVQHLYNVMAAIGWVLAIAATLAAPIGFQVLFDHRYDPSVPMFVALSWSIPMVCLGVAVNAVLTAEGKFWTSAAATALGMVVNVGLNAWMIPRWGGLGSAWATLISYWVAAHGAFLVLPGMQRTFVMVASALVQPDIRRPATK